MTTEGGNTTTIATTTGVTVGVTVGVTAAVMVTVVAMATAMVMATAADNYAGGVVLAKSGHGPPPDPTCRQKKARY